MENNFILSSSPHIRSGETVRGIMLRVILALLPATIYGIYSFGMNAALLVMISIATAVATEAFIQVVMRGQKTTVSDLSAVLTGLLLAMTLPATAPLWIPVVGSVFAIAIGKQVFGGIGHNFVNPALAARAMLMIAYPTQMGNWVLPGPDAVSSATTLGKFAEYTGDFNKLYEELPSLLDSFIGKMGGSLGETSALLLIIGGVYLIVRKIITWHIPVAYIGSAFVMAFLLDGFSLNHAAYQMVIGGLMLGAFFMATDYASSPITSKGKIVYGIGCGVITILIRNFGSLPEGVLYSILLMNVATPLIDRFTKARVFGRAK